ncbi:hypothetical protein PEC18_02745 [Paucibacter sp. O1-1]|nr:hypothetical protein [Paucibacter sp. O1-1]MDA3824796.1 hypothetical protein [Paucibacter sp. O1-1]
MGTGDFPMDDSVNTGTQPMLAAQALDLAEALSAWLAANRCRVLPAR